uniref:Uncharacterized protein n=1 Tax=Wuchereria bancrofti TaxID=6293 RepID=A0AAF5RWE3_WUCBA
MNQNITSLFTANEMDSKKYGTIENNTEVENNNFNFHKETS